MKKTARSYNSTLRKTKGINPITPKTADRNKLWREVCIWRINYLITKHSYLRCEYCGKRGVVDSESFIGVWGHHIDGDRNNTDLSNCYICHTATCHREITDNNIQVTQEDFQGRDA